MTDKHATLRVCYFGTYRQEYARNQIMIEGLRRAGVEVIECHVQLWHGVEDRVRTASGGWLRPAFWWRLLRSYLQLVRRYRQIGAYDILIVGYPGQYDVFLARLLSRIRHKPLVWDVLNSMYLIVLERGIAQRHPLTARLIRSLERLACRLPDMLILDSAEFVAWFQRTHGLKTDRFRLVPIGADDQIFQQAIQDRSVPQPSPNNLFQVLYYGTYIPNHGVEVIVEAARLLQDDTTICFEMVGDGPEKEKAVSLAKSYNLKNITFIEWLDKTELALKIASCDACLGTFGATLQASLTNNNKIYEGFALKKPVISGASPAIPPTLKHGEHLYLCERGDPQSLAKAIRSLKGDPELCRRLGENGYRIFHDKFDVIHIGEAFAAHLKELL
jgi:glycosyltransferase involved in cell wall biosynthesis